MRKLFANLIAGLVWNGEKRRAVRKKILRKVKIEVKAVQNPEDFKKRYMAVKKKWREVCGENAPLRPGRFAEYDFIFGIGSTCHVASVLDRHMFRKFSTPLDWTGGAEPLGYWVLPDVWRDTRFNEKINMMMRDFEGDFELNNFKQVCVSTVGRQHHVVVDVKNNIRYMHTFPINKSLEMHFPEFQEMMKKRVDRFNRAIEKSQKILIVWIHRFADQVELQDQVVSDDDAISAIEKLKKKYPGKDIDIVFFEHDGTKAEYEFDKITVTDGVYRVRSNHYLEEDAYRYKHKYNDLKVQPIIAEALDNIVLTDLLKE